MATGNALFTPAKKYFGHGAYNLYKDDIKIVLFAPTVPADYPPPALTVNTVEEIIALGTVPLIGNNTVDDDPAGGKSLTSKTWGTLGAGIFDAADTTFTTPTATVDVYGLILYKYVPTVTFVGTLAVAIGGSGVLTITAPAGFIDAHRGGIIHLTTGNNIGYYVITKVTSGTVIEAQGDALINLLPDAAVSGAVESPLLAIYDTTSPGGQFPFTTNGGDVTVVWAGAPNYIFKLFS